VDKLQVTAGEISMNFSVSFKGSPKEIEAITSSVSKFERMRSIPGLVLLGALVLVALIALPPIAVVVAVAGFALLAVLTLSWVGTARKAAVAALEFTELSEVAVSDWGLVVTRGAGKSEMSWDEVLHGTRAKAGWIFVSEKGKAAVVLPARVLTDAQAGQLTNLLSEWSARRYRRSPL
jgi:hypothetical protein